MILHKNRREAVVCLQGLDPCSLRIPLIVIAGSSRNLSISGSLMNYPGGSKAGICGAVAGESHPEREREILSSRGEVLFIESPCVQSPARELSGCLGIAAVLWEYHIRLFHAEILVMNIP